MARLVVSKDGDVLKEVPLLKERMTIGRRASNDVRIDDARVSHDHAVIVTAEKHSYVEDLDSTNGTFVNGAPIRKHLLQNNDVIAVGEHRLSYIGSDEGEGADDCGQTLVIPTARENEQESLALVKPQAERSLPAWRNPKNQMAAALTILALSIWGERLYDHYFAEKTAPADRKTDSVIDCKKLYSRVESETMSPEKAHSAVLAAFKQGACKD